MVVMAGGMSAEFGNAMSGVVNMVTREGGSRYDANVEILTSELTGQPQDDTMDLTSGQGYLGGPVPLIPKFNFFFSGSATTKRDFLSLKDEDNYDTTPISSPDPNITYDEDDPYTDQIGLDNLRIHVLDIYEGYLGYGFDNRWNGMLNLSYKLTPSMKLVLSASHNGRWGAPWTDTWRFSMLWGNPKWMQDHFTWGTLEEDGTDYETDIIAGSGTVFLENEKNQLREKNNRLAFVWTHQLNQSTFYSLRGSYYKYDRTMRVHRWVNEEGYYSARSHYFVSATEDTYWTPDDPMHQVELRWIPHSYQANHYGSTDSMDIVERTYGYTSYGSKGMGISRQGSDRYWTNHRDITRTIKGDMTSQITTHHQVKAGFLYNHLALDQFDLQILWYDPPYNTSYLKKPWEFGFYIQDKIEYDFMILNIGARYDGANAGEVPYWVDPRNPIDPASGDVVINPFLTQAEWDAMTPTEQDQYVLPPLSTGGLRSQWSPRVGISHPVTDQAVIYFNYGHFFQAPIYRNLYLEGTLGDGVPLLGNPNMSNEKTVQYEFGYKHQFTDIYAMEVTMWAKDTSNMVGSETIPSFFGGAANPYEYTTFVNYDYSAAKGVDVSLQRRYANFFSARANYSFMTTQSNRDDPWSGYREDHTLDSSPKRPRKLGWDQPHRFSASISVSIPQGAGPALGGMYLLQNINASLIYRANAGRPYTPTTKDRSLEPNSGRRPWTFQWDLKLYRDFETFGLRYSIFADVRNVFSRRNVYGVFSRTGDPDDPGPGASDHSDDYDNSFYYGPPRMIQLGMRIYF
jgi:outer membrane receptor protein involved in Fe transport